MEMTTCEYDGDIKSWNCATDEQCDDCYMIDHEKECGWCTAYDHSTRKLVVQFLPSDYPKTINDAINDKMGDTSFEEVMEMIADGEAKHGEERSVTNE